MLLVVNNSKLEEKRKEKGLSQHKLSLLSGLSNNAIYRMEKKHYKVAYLRAKAVADALECPIDEIFYTTAN